MVCSGPHMEQEKQISKREKGDETVLCTYSVHSWVSYSPPLSTSPCMKIPKCDSVLWCSETFFPKQDQQGCHGAGSRLSLSLLFPHVRQPYSQTLKKPCQVQMPQS